MEVPAYLQMRAVAARRATLLPLISKTRSASSATCHSMPVTSRQEGWRSISSSTRTELFLSLLMALILPGAPGSPALKLVVGASRGGAGLIIRQLMVVRSSVYLLAGQLLRWGGVMSKTVQLMEPGPAGVLGVAQPAVGEDWDQDQEDATHQDMEGRIARGLLRRVVKCATPVNLMMSASMALLALSKGFYPLTPFIE